MRLAPLLLVVGCGAPEAKPAAKPAPITNAASARAEDPNEETLWFAEHCDQESTTFYKVDDRDEVGIVTCDMPSREVDMTDHTAELVHRSSPTRGTTQNLGVWSSGREQGEHYSVVGVVRDAARRATHVLVLKVVGGLDQIPYMMLQDYSPSRRTFTGELAFGATIDVAVAADGRNANVTVCSITKPGGTWDQTKECAQQTFTTTTVFELIAPP